MSQNSQIKKNISLSNETVRELIERSQSGDENARDEIVEHNTRLVWSVVQRFLNLSLIHI